MARNVAGRVNSRSEIRKGAAASSVMVRSNRRAAGAAAKRRAESVRAGNAALSVRRGFLVFLMVIAFATVVMCVQFVRLKQAVVAQTRANEQLMIDLHRMQSENDAMYEDIENSVDLDHVREVAMTTYHMDYAAQDQIVWYNDAQGGYVRQYRSVP